jgi:hypothetical protein
MWGTKYHQVLWGIFLLEFFTFRNFYKVLMNLDIWTNSKLNYIPYDSGSQTVLRKPLGSANTFSNDEF